MNLTSLAIDGAAKILLNHQLWEDVKTFVSDIDGETQLSNDEKHAKVKQDIISIFGDVSNTIINLAITLAVAWAKSVDHEPIIE